MQYTVMHVELASIDWLYGMLSWPALTGFMACCAGQNRLVLWHVELANFDLFHGMLSWPVLTVVLWHVEMASIDCCVMAC